MLRVARERVGTGRNSAILTSMLVFLACLADPRPIQCQSALNSLDVSGLQQAISVDDVAISPGDLLTIVVFDTPEFSGSVRVTNSGTIQIPLIGNITVGGLSLSSASALIRQRLIEGNYLKDPQVTINFSDFTNHSAVLIGEVLRPGPVLLPGSRTLWEVIGSAGGVNPTAGEKVTILHKGNTSAPTIVQIDWNRDLVGQSNPVINPGDTVQVSRAGIVYVIGQVGRQGGYPITHQNLSVAQVIALSEGVKTTAKASHARLIRSTPSGRTVTELDALAILKGKVPDIPLQDGDIVYIPNSVSKVVILRGVEAAIGISSSVLIYRYQ